MVLLWRRVPMFDLLPTIWVALTRPEEDTTTIEETMALFCGRHGGEETIPWDPREVVRHVTVQRVLQSVDVWTRLLILEDCRGWIRNITEHRVCTDFLVVLLLREVARRRRGCSR